MPIKRTESGVPPSKSRLIELGGSFNDTVASFGTHTKTFTPPKGVIWKILNMRLVKGFPTGATFGESGFTVTVGDEPQIYGESVHTSGIEWAYNEWRTADSVQLPSNAIVAVMTLQRIVSDRKNPILIRFDNFTDVSNTKIGVIYVQVLESPMV